MTEQTEGPFKKLVNVKKLLEEKRKEAKKNQDWEKELIEAVNLNSIVTGKLRELLTDDVPSRLRNAYKFMIHETIHFHVLYVSFKLLESRKTETKTETVAVAMDSSSDESRKHLMSAIKVLGYEKPEIQSYDMNRLTKFLHEKAMESSKQMNSIMNTQI